MKKTLMAAVALTAFGATPAMASDTFTVSGSVAPTCSAVADKSLAFNGLSVDSATGILNDTRSVSSEAQYVFCNGSNAKIAIAKTNLSNATAAPSASFTNVISYDAEVKIADTVLGDDNDSAFIAGNLVVKASNLSSAGKIPVAGAYSGTVTVTLTPGA